MFSRHLCSYIVFLLKDWSIPMVYTWYFSRGDFKITLSATHCCLNVSIERKEWITLVIILDLIHLAAWEVLPSFIKHIYSLLTGGNIVGVFKFNILEDVEEIRCVWWLGVKVVGMLWFFLVYHNTVCRNYLWWLHHSGWYFGNTKHDCFDFCL